MDITLTFSDDHFETFYGLLYGLILPGNTLDPYMLSVLEDVFAQATGPAKKLLGFEYEPAMQQLEATYRFLRERQQEKTLQDVSLS